MVLETQTTETSWVFPLSIYLPREIHAFYGLVTKAQVVMGDVVVYAPGFDSALLLYESGAFSAPKSSSIYMAQERAFAELTLGSHWASRRGKSPSLKGGSGLARLNQRSSGAERAQPHRLA